MISLENVSFTYSDGTRALEEIDLKIEDGETLLILGPNGSGKSTLSRLLNGLILPTEGTVLIDGVPTESDDLHARKKVGLVFQNPDDQIVCNSVEEDVSFGPENLGLNREEIEARVNSSIEALGLDDLREKSPFLLSGGQKKKVAIAGVLAMKPEYIVFDDPLSGLDYPSISDLLDEMAKLKRKGYTQVILSHRADKVWRLADGVVVLEGGKIERVGELSEFAFKGLSQYGIDAPSAWKVLHILSGQSDIEDSLEGEDGA